MIRAASTRRVRALPYQFDEHALVLRVDRCTLDGQRDVASSFDPERLLLDLSTLRWRRTRVELSVSIDRSMLDSVYPPDERARPVGRLVIDVICPGTRLRRAVVLVDGPLATGVHRGELELAMADVQGAIELTPLLVRATDRAEHDDGFATMASTRLAAGRAVELRVDAARPVHGEYLDIKYEHFREQGRPYPDALYKLDCDGDAPVLWLNLDHQRICTVLDSAGTVGREARARDVVFAHIGHVVWSHLFWRAARSIARVGDPVHEWEDAVLAHLLPRVYPECPNQESRLAALRADFDGELEDSITERLEGALQDLVEIARRVSSLAEDLA